MKEIISLQENFQPTLIYSMQNTVKTLVIRFNNKLYHNEIELFRGAVVAAAAGGNVLFHNHLCDEKLRYAYPLLTLTL